MYIAALYTSSLRNTNPHNIKPLPQLHYTSTATTSENEWVILESELHLKLQTRTYHTVSE